MKIAVIVLNYNRAKLLKKCLESLNEVEYKDFDVVVVDNGSKDESVEIIKGQFPSVKIIEMRYNSGFCKGNNVGIKFALKNGSEGVVLLNNDTEVDPFFLQEIVKNVDTEGKVGMIAPKILCLNNPNLIDSCGFLITPDGIGKNWGSGEEEREYKYKKAREVFCPSGAATFYCRDLLYDIEHNNQYLDEDFEYCYEELDLGWRARLRGWKCIFAPKAVVYHIGGATGGAFSGFFAYYSNRNLYFNIIKNYPSPFLVAKALGLSLLRYMFYLIGMNKKKGVASEIKKKTGFAKMAGIVLVGLFSVIKKMPEMIVKRRIIQKNKKVKSKEIDEWFERLGLSFWNSLYKL